MVKVVYVARGTFQVVAGDLFGEYGPTTPRNPRGTVTTYTPAVTGTTARG
jgi:hypothetical protein